MAETCEKMGLPVNIEFSGGSELLFGNVSKHRIVLPTREKQWTIRCLLCWIKDNLLRERPELFMQDNNVRPGILVLVNDTDWQLLGELDYKIEENDQIAFISTLHGG